MKKLKYFFCYSLILAPSIIHANNITVTNTTLREQNTAAKTVKIQFNLSWENSWRWNSSNGSISHIGLKSCGENFNGVPIVYIGSQGSVLWTASTSVTIGQMLFTNTNPRRYYIVTNNHTTSSSSPTHTSGTTNNLQFVTIDDGNGSGATATASLSGSRISAFTIVNPGSGYTSPPTVTIASTNGGTNAQADAHIKSWWDAAWVFVKYRVGNGNWQHANISSIASDHIAPSGSTIDPSADGKGVFIYRSTPGTGTVNFSNVKLHWNYAADGVSDAASITVKVFAIEMVYIPEGSFFVGTGSNELESFTDGSRSTAEATLVMNNGSVSNVTIIHKGKGYTTTPLVRFSSGTADPQTFAQATAIRTGDEITGITLVSGGSGYTTVPIITIDPPTSSVAFKITSEASIGIDDKAGKLWALSFAQTTTLGLTAGNTEQTLPAAFPKGFGAFYCMKYEISQGQYRDFLNMLTRTQQESRVRTSIPAGVTSVTNIYVMSNRSNRTHRNGIRCDATIDANNPINFYCDQDEDGKPNESNDGEWIACNFLRWMDGVAYADWSGLRPMTELEFEKACRGPQTPIVNEFIWGTDARNTAFFPNESSIGARRTNSENLSSIYSTVGLNGNIAYYFALSGGESELNGPVRVGVFAVSNSTRVWAGATYYGIMEMGGNVEERVVTVGNSIGRNFTGLHGDGALSTVGNANTNFWPGIDNNEEITNSNGSGFRGGAWGGENGTNVFQISNRFRAETVEDLRPKNLGFRAVRTAPN